jgi:hypothetical protein
MLIIDPNGMLTPGQGRIAALLLKHLAAYLEESGDSAITESPDISEIYRRSELVIDRAPGKTKRG